MSSEKNKEIEIVSLRNKIFIDVVSKGNYKNQMKWSKKSENNLHRLYILFDPEKPVDPFIHELMILKPVKSSSSSSTDKTYLIDINFSKLRALAFEELSNDHTIRLVDLNWERYVSSSGRYYVVANKDKFIQYLKYLIDGKSVEEPSEKIQIEEIHDDISRHFESYQREIVDLRRANYEKQKKAGGLALSNLKPRYNKYIIDEAKLAIYKQIHDQKRVLIEKAMTTGTGKTTEQIQN